MSIDLAQGVVAWHVDDLPDYMSPARPGAHGKEREFEDRERGVRFRVVTGGSPSEAQRANTPVVPFFSPRHRHTFDQIRYYYQGQRSYGKDIHGAGDVFYIPGGVFYGPMTNPEETGEPGENRPVEMTMQFEGRSGIPYYSATEIADARDRLLKKGHFQEGIYVPDEGGRRKDGWEALLEEHTGKKIEYPEACLSDYVVVQSARLPWRAVPGLPGVEAKYVAHFTEAGPNVMLVKMAAGSRTPAGATSETNQQLRGLFKGRVRYAEEDRDFTPVSFRYVAPGASFGETECLEDAEFLIVKWATDGATYLPDPQI